MKAADVMVSNVITVDVNASIGEVAAILLNNHISGAPVVGEKGELVGIVSEGDLIRRPEIGTTKRHSWWLELVSNEWALATEYIKSHSRKVADVMTRDVITAKPDTPLGDIAATLERNRIKRVPIVEGNKLVGIVSRANILQALASATKKLSSLTTADDSELRKGAARYRLPAVCPFRFYAELGCLLSYGNEQIDNFSRAAQYADRILKGAKPSDLPVQAPVNRIVHRYTFASKALP